MVASSRSCAVMVAFLRLEELRFCHRFPLGDRGRGRARVVLEVVDGRGTVGDARACSIRLDRVFVLVDRAALRWCLQVSAVAR